MSDSTAVPIIVHSAAREQVEALNSVLRRSGLAVRCTWIPAVQDIADAFEQLNPELLICCPGSAQELQELARVRDQVAINLPLIAVRESVDEQQIAADMALGARDSVSLQHDARLTAVIQRELRVVRLERALGNTLRASQDYRSKLEAVLQRSNDAIAQVQEGILVDANTAWLELFSLDNATALVGQPIMDLFDQASHAPLRGALTACMQGRWADHALKVGAIMGEGSVVPLEILLARGEFEGESSVHLIVPAQKRDDQQLARKLEQAVHTDPVTGMWTRRRLLALMQERLAVAVRGGVRALVCVRPDKFPSIESELGILGSEQFITEFAAVIKSLLGPHDLAGHLGGTTLLLLIERGNGRDVEAWCESLVERIDKHVFPIGAHGLHATCTVGSSPLPQAQPELNAAVLEALGALRRGRDRGGNQVTAIDKSDQDTRVQAYDQIWVRHIRSALMENRFRLVQQPIASLRGGNQRIFDVAIRMLDAQGKDVLPSEFLPAAARNDLMKNIDRWVLGASLSSIAKQQPDLLFVRLSKDSLLDASLPPWLEMQIKSMQAQPQRLCVQVTEDAASRYLQAAQTLLGALRERGLCLALEHFGTGADSLALLDSLPLDYLKIDGSLMQGLAGSPDLQRRVRLLVEAASHHGLQTVAEHIEDANTMAVVWQLGVQYIQGYLVHAPEEVVLRS